MDKVWRADNWEICRTYRLRVETKEICIECDVCKMWSHAKCEKITKDGYKAFEKKNFSFS